MKIAAHPAFDGLEPGELPVVGSGPATPIAHGVTRLVLLPPGPDTIRGVPLPEPRASTPTAAGRDPLGPAAPRPRHDSRGPIARDQALNTDRTGFNRTRAASGGDLGPARRSQVQGIASSPLSAARRVYQMVARMNGRILINSIKRSPGGLSGHTKPQ